MHSIKKPQDFKKVYGQGKYAADNLFVVYALANELDENRVGITVSKKVGCAVVRNRIKRWVRESYRLSVCPNIESVQANFDLVIIARAPAGELKGKGAYGLVDVSVKRLLGKVGRKAGFTLYETKLHTQFPTGLQKGNDEVISP